MDTIISEGKVYKERALWVGTFLGGPLVAGYFFSKNFKTLGEPEKATPTWVIAIIATIVIFTGVFMIPESVKIPNQLIPLAYTAIAFGLFKTYQEKGVTKHLNQGGKTHGWGNIIGVSIAGLLATIIPVFSFAFASDLIDQANTSTKTYGTAIQHEISFDQSNISEAEVDNIAEGFREAGFFDLSVPKYVYASKDGDKYEISIAVVSGMENDADALQPFVELREEMDRYLPNHAVEFKLVVDYLDNVVKVLK